jgi:DNA-binding transcriptional MerR regulator
MKGVVLGTALAAMILAGGYWATGRGTPPAGKAHATAPAVAVGGESHFKREPRPPHAGAQPMLPLAGPIDAPPQADKEAQVYDLNDPADQERFAAALRAEGATEEDIRIRLKLPAAEPPQTGMNDAQAQVYDLNDPANREQFAASLRAGGSTEEDIRKILRQPAEEPPPQAGMNDAQAQVYDLNDPADQEQFAASMRAGGASESDVQKILSKSR